MCWLTYLVSSLSFVRIVMEREEQRDITTAWQRKMYSNEGRDIFIVLINYSHINCKLVAHVTPIEENHG